MLTRPAAALLAALVLSTTALSAATPMRVQSASIQPMAGCFILWFPIRCR